MTETAVTRATDLRVGDIIEILEGTDPYWGPGSEGHQGLHAVSDIDPDGTCWGDSIGILYDPIDKPEKFKLWPWRLHARANGELEQVAVTLAVAPNPPLCTETFDGGPWRSYAFSSPPHPETVQAADYLTKMQDQARDRCRAQVQRMFREWPISKDGRPRELEFFFDFTSVTAHWKES